MRKTLIHLLGLASIGAALVLPNKMASSTLAEEEIDSQNSYNLEFYDDFNGTLKDGWSYVKGGSSYSYREGDSTKYGWLFNGQDHVQYKRHNNPTDFGKFLYGDEESSNYVFEVKIRADTKLGADEFINKYNNTDLGKHLTINSIIPFFVQNNEPSASYQSFYGRGICFTNYAIGFYQCGETSATSGWAESIRLNNAKIPAGFSWASWHTVRVLANDNLCRLYLDGNMILETAQSKFSKAPATNGPCGFGANVNLNTNDKVSYDSLHFDDFKFYKANPNYKRTVESISTNDLLDKNKVKNLISNMVYEKVGETNKVGINVAEGKNVGTQLTTFDQEYKTFEMDVAVDLDNQLALKNTTSEDKATQNIRVSAESGIIFGSGNPSLTGNYFMVGTEIIHSNSSYQNKTNISLASYLYSSGDKSTYKKISTVATVVGTHPILRLSAKDKTLDLTVFANAEDYKNQVVAATGRIDYGAGDGDHLGFRCNPGNNTLKLVYEAEILSFSTSDVGDIEYPSTTVKIADEENRGPYTISIPSLENGVIKDGDTVLTSDVSINEHGNKKLDIVPNEGYSISSVSINGKNIGPSKQIILDNVTRNVSIDVKFTSTKSIDVYLIAGQSNAAGYTPINGLHKGYTYGGEVNQDRVNEYEDGYENVFYYGATKINDPVSYGNMDFDIVRAGNGTAASYMGPELGFGEYVSPILAKQNKQAAVIKYAVGSTGFANSTSDTVKNFGNWLSPTSLEEEKDSLVEKSGLLYKNLLSVVESGLSDLIERGYNPVIKGLMWFQGCADAGSEALSSNYAHHLSNLINDLRTDLTALENKLSIENGSLKVAVAKINDNLAGANYEDIVREQIQLVANTLDDVRVIDTKGMVVPNPEDNNDRWHFSSKDMLTIGNMFGQVMMEENGYVEPETYAVTFNTDGGSDIAPLTLKKWDSLDVTNLVPTKAGYNFVKWVIEGSEEEINYNDFSITSNITLKAIYEKTSEPVSSSSEESSSSKEESSSAISESPSSSSSSSSKEEPAPTDSKQENNGGCGGAITSSIIGSVVVLGATIAIAYSRKRKE